MKRMAASTHRGLPILVASSRSYKSAAEVPGREQDDIRPAGVSAVPQVSRVTVARALGLPQDKVHGIWVPGPGSYRRNDAGDAGIDAALLSKAVGRPVRVQGMRYEGMARTPRARPRSTAPAPPSTRIVR